MALREQPNNQTGSALIHFETRQRPIRPELSAKPPLAFAIGYSMRSWIALTGFVDALEV